MTLTLTLTLTLTQVGAAEQRRPIRALAELEAHAFQPLLTGGEGERGEGERGEGERGTHAAASVGTSGSRGACALPAVFQRVVQDDWEAMIAWDDDEGDACEAGTAGGTSGRDEPMPANPKPEPEPEPEPTYPRHERGGGGACGRGAAREGTGSAQRDRGAQLEFRRRR